MSDLRWIEGQNLVLETCHVQGQTEWLPDPATARGKIPSDVIVTTGSPASFAARSATPTMPIVFAAGNVVGTGVVDSPAHFAGTSPGVHSCASTGGSVGDVKQLELLKQWPSQSSAGSHGTNLGNSAKCWRAAALKGAARGLGPEFRVLDVCAEDDPAGALVWPADALHVGGIPLTLATVSGLPTLRLRTVCQRCTSAHFVEWNGLAVHRFREFEGSVRMASLVDRVFRGAGSAYIPADTPTTFDFIVNRTTARALGLVIPQEVALQVARWRN